MVDGLLPRSLSQLASVSLSRLFPELGLLNGFFDEKKLSSLGWADIFLEGGGPNIIFVVNLPSNCLFFWGSGEARPLASVMLSSLPPLSITKCSVKRLIYPLSCKNWSSNATFL